MWIKNRYIYLMMSLSMLTWGVAWSSAKIINLYLPYLELVFLRFVIGFLSILPLLFKFSFDYRNVNIMQWINMFIISILFFLYNICFFIGTDLGDAGRGGVFVTTINPIITFIIISIVKKEIYYFQLIAILFGFFGGILIIDIYNNSWAELLINGELYFIACAFIWGIMTVLMSEGQQNINSIWYISICYLLTSIICWPFIKWENIYLNINLFNFEFYCHLFIVCSAMSFGTSIYIYSAPILGSIRVSAFIFSVPFIAIITSYFITNEPFSFNVVLGGIMSIFSIYLINFKK